MIQVFEPYITLKDKVNVFNAINSKNISGSSEQIRKFESQLSELFDRDYAISVSNGSTALDIALLLSGVKKGDEVILPSFTIISCLAAVVRTGAKPVFCDVDINTWNMTMENVSDVVSKNTKAILMVHTYGLTAEAKEIEQFCRKNKIFLIEDAAEAHGQNYLEKKCGSFGDVSTLSFYANKHITTGEGGALLTNSKDLFEKSIQMRNLDFNNKHRFKHENLFWNYRLGGLQAALGSSQINNINYVIQNKKKQAHFYNKFFQDYSHLVQTPVSKTSKNENHYWVYGLTIKNNFDRDKLMHELRESGIETRPFFWPLHLQDIKKYKVDIRTDLKNSEYLGSKGLYIPLGPHLNQKKQKYICESIVKILSKS